MASTVLKSVKLAIIPYENYYLKTCLLLEFEAKTTAHRFIKFRRQIEHTGKAGIWPLFDEFIEISSM